MRLTMRLSESEHAAIIKSFEEIKKIYKTSGELFLFGSRTDNSKRGGDIDLLWICPKADIERVRSSKFDFISKIQFYSEPQKIDLTIIADEDKFNDIFYRSICQDLVQIVVHH